MQGAAQTGAISLEFGEAGQLASAGLGESLLSPVLPLGEEEEVDSAREEVQLAGPVRRSSRRTARRTSRRQEVIYD
jgi:hypothetical protein